MNQHSNPLDYIIRCCEQGLVPQPFDISNAKDELKRLREHLTLNYEVIGWARINSRGDIYNLGVCFNPHLDPNTVLPIYSNKQEFQEKYGKLSK